MAGILTSLLTGQPYQTKQDFETWEPQPNGIYERFHWDESESKLVVERRQPVDWLLDRNKREFNDAPDLLIAQPKSDFRKVAHIPNILLEKWQIEEGIRWWDRADWPRIQKKLNDPEHRFLRTAPGKI